MTESKPINPSNSQEKGSGMINIFGFSCHTGVLLGSISIFLTMFGAALTFPFLQSQRDFLGCDALCYGSMQSARSGLSLVGSALAGRMSDSLGRVPVLWLGLIASISSYIVALFGESILAMWLAMIPAALLNQNFSVLKALFADYQHDLAATESQRASALGRLGMSVGISFMIGPIIAASFLKSHSQAMTAAIMISLLAGACLVFLPTPHIEIQRRASHTHLENLANEEKGKKRDKVTLFHELTEKSLSFLSLPVAKTPGAKLLFFVRCGMGMAFHIFMTVWPLSLRSRFNFGPSEHAYFMGWIGLCYALSQGFVAQILIRLAGEDSTYVLAACLFLLGVGRVLALNATSIVFVYIVMAFVIVALGVVNTSISSACSRIAGADQVGGLFGIMEAVENLAGLMGPFLGGILYRYNTNAPIVTVVSIYLILLMAVGIFYKSTILQHNPPSDEKDKSD